MWPSDAPFKHPHHQKWKRHDLPVIFPERFTLVLQQNTQKSQGGYHHRPAC